MFRSALFGSSRIFRSCPWGMFFSFSRHLINKGKEVAHSFEPNVGSLLN